MLKKKNMSVFTVAKTFASNRFHVVKITNYITQYAYKEYLWMYAMLVETNGKNSCPHKSANFDFNFRIYFLMHLRLNFHSQ